MICVIAVLQKEAGDHDATLAYMTYNMLIIKNISGQCLNGAIIFTGVGENATDDAYRCVSRDLLVWL